ncbi:hypothetical protein MRB53_031091 [Persea americana]|uniref:Uncharacterized protein n=1 Tax=Persea americana TaxID=3435 RepID=A0ACC2KP32_PERAE|nr:hypothetical protein MRB53_031091 [Persea americana]
MNEEMMMDPMEVRKTSSTTIERNKAAEGLTIREGAAKEDEKLAEAGGGYGNAGWAAEKVVRSICSPQGRRWERVPRTESEIKRQGWQSEGYIIVNLLLFLMLICSTCKIIAGEKMPMMHMFPTIKSVNWLAMNVIDPDQGIGLAVDRT